MSSQLVKHSYLNKYILRVCKFPQHALQNKYIIQVLYCNFT